MNQTKALKASVSNEDLGEVEAVFSTLDVVDKDGDITPASAFRDGQRVKISAYNHSIWDGAMPVGVGTIHVDGNEAILKGRFFMSTTGGRETFEVVKALGESQEWSYGFEVMDSEKDTKDGKPVRILKDLNVFEVSPVFIGAGVNTHTRSAKSADEGDSDDTSTPDLSQEIAREYARFLRNSL